MPKRKFNLLPGQRRIPARVKPQCDECVPGKLILLQRKMKHAIIYTIVCDCCTNEIEDASPMVYDSLKPEGTVEPKPKRSAKSLNNGKIVMPVMKGQPYTPVAPVVPEFEPNLTREPGVVYWGDDPSKDVHFDTRK